MKFTFVKKGFALLVGLMLVLVLVTPAFAAAKSRVFIEFKPGTKAAVKSALVGAKAEFHYTFKELKSFVVTVPTTALKGLKKNPNIVSIEVDPERYLVPAAKKTVKPGEIPYALSEVPYGVDMVQAREIWDPDFDLDVNNNTPTGAGMTVCIIDTGYYQGHEDLKDAIGGISQVDDDWSRDGYGHGTHVAGTISALPNGLGVVGVTPGAVDLYIVKIFDDLGAWVTKAHASDLIAAAYSCRDGGADVISMSLSGTNKSGKEERAFNSLYEAGILSIAAASNDGLDVYHYPASYDSVVSVAALDSEMVVADFSQFNDQVELAAPGVDVLSTIPYTSEAYVAVDGATYTAWPMEYAATGTVSGELVDGGLCRAIDPIVDWTGKVVLCSRGEVSFAEKVTKVMDSGGTAAVIYNNVEGLFSGTMGEAGDWILAVSISMEDGQYLVANKLGMMAEVASIYTWPASGYEAWSGTSMSTPHVSAVAALIWSAHPAWTNVQIREAMQITALDLGDPGRDVHYGFGLVQAKDALDYLKALVP